MTERLSDLLTREADGLVVPPAPADAVLRRGRALRRRRRVGAAVAAGAAGAVVAVVATGLLLAGPSGGGGTVAPADPTDAPDPVGAAFAVGPTVFLDGGAVSATLEAAGVRRVLLTSAGVLAQGTTGSGERAAYVLVRPDGTTRTTDVPATAEVSTDAAQPLAAWSEQRDGRLVVVVADVTTDERLAEVAVPDHTGGFAPVALDGDHVYVGDGFEDLEGGAFALDVAWRLGTTVPDFDLEHVDEIAGGRSNLGYGGDVSVVDVASGRPLLTVRTPERGATYFRLSPDGRFARLQPQGGRRPATVEVYDVDRGTHVDLPAETTGWTRTGETVGVSTDGTLSVCSPSTGECESTDLGFSVDPDVLVLAGTGDSS